MMIPVSELFATFAFGEPSADRPYVVTLVGNNGSGKSRALGVVAESWINEGIAGLPELPHAVSSVVAMSNVVTDPFNSSRLVKPGYSYRGLRRTGSSISTRALEYESAVSMIELSRSEAGIQQLNFIEGEVELASRVILKNYRVGMLDKLQEVKWRRRSSSANRVESEMVWSFDSIGLDRAARESIDPRGIEDELMAFVAHFEQCLRRLVWVDGGPRETGVRVELTRELLRIGRIIDDFAGRLSEVIGFELPGRSLVQFLERTVGVRFEASFLPHSVPLDDRKFFLHSGASAGQMIYFSSLARVAAALRSEVLFLIDEPEVGLHPEWQGDYIGNLRELTRLAGSPNCVSFLLATHSPFLVGDADLVIRCEPDGYKVIAGNSALTLNEVLVQCFSARTFSSGRVEGSLRSLTEWIALASFDANPSREAESSYRYLKDLDHGKAPAVSLILAEFERLTGRRAK